MVNSDGQLFTIEGISAALILLITAYIVVNSTSVYTAGDTHISDMQLEVIGSDALRMMNIAPNSTYNKTPLQRFVETDDADGFSAVFSSIVNNRTSQDRDRIQFMANITYVEPFGNNRVNSSVLSTSEHPLVGGEHPVRVAEWLIVEKKFPGSPAISKNGKHAVLVEVLLWRD